MCNKKGGKGYGSYRSACVLYQSAVVAGKKFTHAHTPCKFPPNQLLRQKHWARRFASPSLVDRFSRLTTKVCFSPDSLPQNQNTRSFLARNMATRMCVIKRGKPASLVPSVCASSVTENYCLFSPLDGRKETVMFDKITSRISKLCYGLNDDFIEPVISLSLSLSLSLHLLLYRSTG